MKFDSTYPYGTTYAQNLMHYLEVMELPWSKDPRNEGGDSWGFLISRDQAALDALLEDIHKRMKEAEAYQEEMEQCTTPEEEEAVIEKFDFSGEPQDHYWDAHADEVISIETDWKHLEIWGHDEELRKVGIELQVLETTDENGFKKVITLRPL